MPFSRTISAAVAVSTALTKASSVDCLLPRSEINRFASIRASLSFARDNVRRMHGQTEDARGKLAAGHLHASICARIVAAYPRSIWSPSSLARSESSNAGNTAA